MESSPVKNTNVFNFKQADSGNFLNAFKKWTKSQMGDENIPKGVSDRNERNQLENILHDVQ